MQLQKIRLHIIEMPLKRPFVTHLETISLRRAIIIEVIDTDGRIGLGEVTAFTSPWYTEETIKTAHHMLVDFLIPLLSKATIQHPREISQCFTGIKRNSMAKAGLEGAIWDLYAKQQSKSLKEIIGGVRDQVSAGAVVASLDPIEAIKQIEQFIVEGYTRVKVKLNPKQPYLFIKEIRTAFPNLSLAVDANSAFTIKDLNQLKSLDSFNLLFIEEPLEAESFGDYQLLQKEISTPIALDESITSFQTTKLAIDLKSCKMVNVKSARVGGISETLKIHDYCRERRIPILSGGMIEFGVSRAHTLVLASLEGFTIPGDLSAANRFWEKDIVSNEVVVENGMIRVPEGPGIGVDLDHHQLKKVTLNKLEFDLKKA